VPGTPGFVVRSFAISGREDKVVISGNREEGSGRRCGLFEILISSGNVRQVLNSDCRYQWTWDHLSLSPDGGQAIATLGSNTDHNLHLELIDLVHGTTRPLSSEFWVGVWSPDGKWIAALANRNRKLFLIDAHDFSKRRDLGGTSGIAPEWSPDSRYLLLWRHELRCGIGIDVDTPATLEALDIKSGKRLRIRSSECQLLAGSTGWISSEITK
jgi:Tol biopolymer transport system component